MNSTQTARYWRSHPQWLAVLTLALLVVSFPHSTLGHDLFTAYIQHKLTLTISKQHLDVVLDLTFFEEWSARERHAMDANADGSISTLEREDYAKELGTNLADQVKLMLANRPITLVPLYEPAVDLLGNNRTTAGHHRLRLSFFIPTPDDLKAGDLVSLRESLWPGAKALASLEVQGRDGFKAESQVKPRVTWQDAGQERIFNIRLLEIPVHRKTADRNL